VDVGGLARSDAAGGFEIEFGELSESLRAAQDGAPQSPAGSAGPAGPAESAADDATSTAVSSGNDQALGSPEGE
jgi:hypothetical protein